MGEDLARENMRSIWREQKYQERKFQCVWKGTSKCPQKCETCKSRTSRTVELDKPLGNDSDGSDTFYEPADPTDITEFLEQKAVLDTLYAALATLTQKDRELITDRIIHEKTVRELAPKYDFKSSRSITVHVRRVLDILRNDEALEEVLSNHSSWYATAPLLSVDGRGAVMLLETEVRKCKQKQLKGTRKCVMPSWTKNLQASSRQ